ncbi:hypothetical protein F2Q68_00002107 [Brassica cretica]|uniref:tRNA (adenine(58)-N(1))-methyltransferase n=1 Tax=Brassica cretica TaxID=69181 RepID=A0A8S9J4D5_BRACR|nr:hypothetical protein F2Q68_00002107 [Brassica cretica]
MKALLLMYPPKSQRSSESLSSRPFTRKESMVLLQSRSAGEASGIRRSAHVLAGTVVRWGLENFKVSRLTLHPWQLAPVVQNTVLTDRSRNHPGVRSLIGIRNGIISLVTIEVRDIKGQGFHEKLSGLADSVFLDLPQSWLAVPSAAKMLKEDGVLCSFSPCIEQVQRTCEVLRSDFIEIRTFEVLLRT